MVQVGSALAGYRIQQVHVREGQTVAAGDRLVTLDASAAEAELRLAEAQHADAVERQQAEVAMLKERVATAELAVRQADQGKQLELSAARSRVELATLKLQQAEQDLDRATQLRQLTEPLVSQQQVEQQRLAFEAAVAELNAARAARKQLEQSLVFRDQTAAAELRTAQQALDVARKGAGLESLAQTVALAQLKLERTRIDAPSAGTVLHVLINAGELVSPQPLLQMANLDALACMAEVYAADVPLLSVGQRARIRSRAFQDSELTGTIERIGSVAGPPALRPLDPRQPVDRTVAKVVVSIDARSKEPPAGSREGDRRIAWIGLQVEVEFTAGP
jgi:HlyD family secretion protein